MTDREAKEVTLWTFGDATKAMNAARDGYVAGIFDEPLWGVEIGRGCYITLRSTNWGPAAEQLKENIAGMLDGINREA